MAQSKNNMPTLAKADVFRPKDVYTIVNAVLQDVTGQRTITAVDTSSFINVGQMCLSTSKEGTFEHGSAYCRHFSLLFRAVHFG